MAQAWQLIDSHCHLDDGRFDGDRRYVLTRAAAAGVTGFVVPSVVCRGFARLRALAASSPVIHPAFGLHPWFCAQHAEEDLAILPEFLSGAVAVGECGLDGGAARAPEHQQLRWFTAQLDLALETGLPVIVHAYKAVDPVCREIRRRPGLRGVIHGFSGSQSQADVLIGLGFYLGVGSAVSYAQNRRLQQTVAVMPSERLLVESDAPDQPPAGHRGERNEPAFLLEIVQQIATLRGIDGADLVEICNRNVRELFKL